MKYYGVFTDQSGKAGVPIFFEARIFDLPIEGDAFSKQNSIYYDWMKPGFSDDVLKSEFYLYTKNQQLNFDYYKFSKYYIISEDFLSVINQYNKGYTKSELHIFSANNNQRLNLKKKYFFVKFNYSEHLVDYTNSIYEAALSDKGEPIIHNGLRYIRRYDQIELITENINSEVFLIKDNILGFHLFCTETFKIHAENSGVYALIFVGLQDYPDFVKHSGFLGKETYNRLKKRET